MTQTKDGFHNVAIEHTDSLCQKGCFRQSVNFPCCDRCHREPSRCICRGGPAKVINRVAGLTTAVVDDANQTVYIYGNIIHEDHHLPSDCSCQPFIKLPAELLTDYTQIRWIEENFSGEFMDNSIIIKFDPILERPFFVFLNGLKQTMGQEDDYVLKSKTIRFNIAELADGDKVSICYYYRAEV